MKKSQLFRTLIISSVLIITAVFVYPKFICLKWDECCCMKKKTPNGYVCKGYKYFSLDTMGGIIDPKKDTILNNPNIVRDSVPYVCNQIIFTPSSAGNDVNVEIMRKYLSCQGFKLTRTCACNDGLELWDYQDPGDADIITIITDPPKDDQGKGIGGLSFNFEVSMGDTYDYYSARDQTKREEIEPSYSYSHIPISIAITDTGVDIDEDGQLRSNQYLWDSPMTPCQPGQLLGTFGLNMLAGGNPFLSEPVDLQGHGTFICGILAGMSNSTDVGTKLLNIKVTNGGSFSVFDAVCGIFFGINQGVKLFNLSWGYLDTIEQPEPPYIFTMLLNNLPDDVILVAGMGNNHKSLDGDLRFWPACLAETDSRFISVGAVSNDAANPDMASFSNRSSFNGRMTLVAPGENITSLAPLIINGVHTSGYASGSGTSYATPFVTRKVAKIMVDFSTSDPVIIKAKILNNPYSDPIPILTGVHLLVN